MRSALRSILIVVGVVVLGVPLAVVAAFLLWPVWSWIEAGLGIESIGHGFPANWCFIATYAVIVVVTLLLLRRRLLNR